VPVLVALGGAFRQYPLSFVALSKRLVALGISRGEPPLQIGYEVIFWIGERAVSIALVSELVRDRLSKRIIS
jgi:hypothetical protein